MKAKKASRKERILLMLNNPTVNMTCGEICKRIVEEEKLTGNIARYLSGSISSILSQLVHKGVLEYNQNSKGPKGGHVYQIKTVTND